MGSNIAMLEYIITTALVMYVHMGIEIKKGLFVPYKLYLDSSFLSSLDLQTQAQKFVKIPPAIFFLYF